MTGRRHKRDATQAAEHRPVPEWIVEWAKRVSAYVDAEIAAGRVEYRMPVRQGRKDAR